MFETVILQSAGSLAVAVVALLMLVLQTAFYFKRPQLVWYAWSTLLSFSAFLYAVGIFFEYNTPVGALKLFSGKLEWTAIVCAIHCLYGFSFSFLNKKSGPYHLLAGIWHLLLLIILWATDTMVADRFVARQFSGLQTPFIEADLGPLGPLFVVYTASSAVAIIFFWLRSHSPQPKYRFTYLAGMGLWIALGVHDGVASLGVPTIQYVMEYGFLGFSLVVLGVVFSNYLDLEVEDHYRTITELAYDCILVFQDNAIVFDNPSCTALCGFPLRNQTAKTFLRTVAAEDRRAALRFYSAMLRGEEAPSFHTLSIRRTDGELRYLEIACSAITYKDRPALLAVMRDCTNRKRSEKERNALIAKLQAALDDVKSLSGLLPICSACKKIRDDKGYWTQIESYITEHSEADFTHSICPDCARKLYPNIKIYPD